MLAAAPPSELRGYQQRPLERLAAGENILLVLPTGAGKTEVALQRTLALLRADPNAKTVMLVPNVTLAYQQAGTEFRSPRAQCFKRDIRLYMFQQIFVFN